MPAEHPHPRAPRTRPDAPHAAVIGRSIPLEIADVMAESGAGLTIEEMCVATGRSEAEIRKHAPEGRRIARARATRTH